MLTVERHAETLFAMPPVLNGPSADPDVSDVSTWRWHVGVILRAQRDAELNHPSNGEDLTAKVFGRYISEPRSAALFTRLTNRLTWKQ
jgi:hypothetical protein